MALWFARVVDKSATTAVIKDVKTVCQSEALIIFAARIVRENLNERKKEMSKTKAHIRYRSTVQKLKNGNGVIFPGVTTIVGILDKPALLPWANKLGLKGIEVGKYVDDKADIGTLAHAMITNQLLNKPTDTADYTANQISKAENATLSYFEWEKSHKIKPLLIEQPLVSESLEYGGICDIFAYVDEFSELIDLKTGSGIYQEHFIQVAAYKALLEENGHPVDRVRILNIPRAETENFQECIVANLDKNFEIFKHCLAIYKLRKEITKG